MDRSHPTRFALAMIAFAAVAGAAAVALGALAAHALAEPARELAATASHYAFVHVLAILAGALLHDRLAPAAAWPRRLVALALVLFASGIVLFSGGLMALAGGFGAGAAPVGGLAFIAGWLALATSALTALLRRAP